jgi:hypothetical protein
LTMNVLKEYLRILSLLFLGIFSHTETFFKDFCRNKYSCPGFCESRLSFRKAHFRNPDRFASFSISRHLHC